MKQILFLLGVFIFCLFNPAAPRSSDASPQEATKLTSLKTGYYYVSRSTGEGAVQLSDCLPVAKLPADLSRMPFACLPDAKGLRCTADGSLDVVFVFKKVSECQSDRSKMLSSEEE